MGKTLLFRCAAAAASGLLTLAVAAPALAHGEPAPGFNAVLHGPHHDKVATDEGWPMCETVRDDAGAGADSLIKDGYDVWVFNASPATFDFSEGVTTLRVTFKDLSGEQLAVTVPGAYSSWIGPEANPHLVAVSVPAGWTLLDGDFAIGKEIRQGIRVTHTCPGEPADDPPGTPPPSEQPPGEETPEAEPPVGEPGDEDDPEPALPVTGSSTSRLIAAGAGLLVVGAAMTAGAAMLTLRRRRRLSGLTSE